MSFEDKYNQSALETNMSQLASLLVTKEKLVRISAPQIECDYVFHYGGLEYKAKNLEFKSLLLNKQIELKCQDQSLSPEQTKEQALLALKAQNRERLLMGKRVVDAVKRLEEPVPSNKDIVEMEKVLESLFLKLHPVLLGQTSPKNVAILDKALKYFESGSLKPLQIINLSLPKPKPIPKENIAKHNLYVTLKIKQTVETVTKIQKSYPFNKVELIANRQELPGRITQLEEKIKKEQNKIRSLEKTLNSLF